MTKSLKQLVKENKSRADEFIDAVAEFLSTDVGRKSIELEMDAKGFSKPDARCWARIANAVNIGYATKEETILQIRRLLFVGV